MANFPLAGLLAGGRGLYRVRARSRRRGIRGSDVEFFLLNSDVDVQFAQQIHPNGQGRQKMIGNTPYTAVRLKRVRGFCTDQVLSDLNAWVIDGNIADLKFLKTHPKIL
jgi:hypothetical protein